MNAPTTSPMVSHSKLLTAPVDVSRVKKEQGVKDLIKRLLNQHGWFTWMPGANGFGTQGVLDHLAFKEGVFLVVEAKFGTNKPSTLQKAFACQILANDGFAFCVNERNIDHFANWLESFEVAKLAQMAKEEIPAVHGSRMLNAISALTDAFAGG